MKSNDEYNIEVQEILKKYDRERNKYKLVKNLSMTLLCFSAIVMFIVFSVPILNNRLLMVIISFALIGITAFLWFGFDIKLNKVDTKIIGETEQIFLKDYNYSTKKIEKDDFEKTLLGKRIIPQLHYHTSNEGVLYYKLDGCDCLIGTVFTTNKKNTILPWTFIKKTLKTTNDIRFYADLDEGKIITENENLKESRIKFFDILKKYGEDVLVESDGQYLEILVNEVRFGYVEKICPEELSKESMESEIKELEQMIREVDEFVSSL